MTMEFKLNNFHRNTLDQELLDDLKTVAKKLGKDSITSREYNEKGKYTSVTISRRFGDWNKALQKADLIISVNKNISDNELFKNIEDVWIKLGRQPTNRDMQIPFSKYSRKPYINRFKTWRNALEAFVEFINSDNEQDVVISEKEDEVILEKEIILKHKTKRNPSERLKVQVLMRDGNKCRLCGLVLTGDNIHFDHILAWSKGGETTLENLQILCEKHNLAKGNL